MSQTNTIGNTIAVPFGPPRLCCVGSGFGSMLTKHIRITTPLITAPKTQIVGRFPYSGPLIVRIFAHRFSFPSSCNGSSLACPSYSKRLELVLHQVWPHAYECGKDEMSQVRAQEKPAEWRGWPVSQATAATGTGSVAKKYCAGVATQFFINLKLIFHVRERASFDAELRR